MKNRLSDLNNQLFETLERLNDENLKGDELREEISRASAVTSVASQIIGNASLVLKARVAVSESFSGDVKLPKMLEE